MTDFLEKKSITAVIALITLITGFLFTNYSNMTGNVVLSNKMPINLLSLVGILLIACSIILGIYSVVKKNNK